MLEILLCTTPREVPVEVETCSSVFLLCCSLRSDDGKQFHAEISDLSEANVHEDSGEGRLQAETYSCESLCHALSSKDTSESIVWLIGNS